MKPVTTGSLTVSAAIVIVLNYVLNLYGIQPMPPDVTMAAGVVVHAIGMGVVKLFARRSPPAPPPQPAPEPLP